MQYAILSDIHANADALKAVLEHIPPDMPIWFLGDAVGYYPDFHEVLELLQNLQQSGRLTLWIKGNHDLAALDLSTTRMMEELARKTIELTAEQLTATENQLLSEIAEPPVAISESDMNIVVSHGGCHDPIGGYVQHAYDAKKSSEHCTAVICLVGHTHVPRKFFLSQTNLWKEQPLFSASVSNDTFTFNGEIKVILNPGSVGQPRDGFGGRPDGFPHAAYAVLDTEAQTFAVHRVRYDTEPVKARTRQWLQKYVPEEKLTLHVDRLDYNYG